MKQFTTIKVGYTSSKMYGCSGEYFTTVIFKEDGEIETLHFYGMYGVEERVARALKENGFKEYYTPSIYGKMVRSDITKMWISENEVLKIAVDIK